MMHMALSCRSHEDKVDDGWVDVMGCIRLFYPYFIIFVVLVPMDILVFWMSI
jgi:hypothetical protein